jgi:MFS family permease
VIGGAVIHFAAALPPLVIFGSALRVWQLAFVISGAGGLLIVLPVLFVREPQRRGLARREPGAGSVALIPFLVQNRALLTCHFGAFSLSAIMGMGSVAWMPSFFIRVHHWSASQIGFVYGGVLAVVGGVAILAGGRLAGWLDRRGMRDVYLRLPLVCLAAAAPFSIATILVPDARWAAVCLAASTFIGSMSVPSISVALQLVTPNELRGQVLALFGFVGNIVGPALGPIIIAALTDYLFRDPHAVGLALGLATLVITPVVSVLRWLGLAPFRESLARADSWSGVEHAPGLVAQ